MEIKIKTNKNGVPEPDMKACGSVIGGTMQVLLDGLSTALKRNTALNAKEEATNTHLIWRLSVRHPGNEMAEGDMAHMTFVELAPAGSKGQERTSLSAIADVVAAAAESSRHVPFRSHPLTVLIADCICEKSSKTLMLACASVEPESLSETMNTLNYARRCKGVKKHKKSRSDPNMESPVPSVFMGHEVTPVQKPGGMKYQHQFRDANKENNGKPSPLMRSAANMIVGTG
uniref:Kinesin motor domain-containing protein n=1 Tax=Octactis speculum TaxID=3111310 RepID=A0A7S2DS61_9STRA